MKGQIHRTPGQVAIVLKEEDATALGIPPTSSEVEVTGSEGALTLIPEDPDEETIERILSEIDPSTLHEYIDWGKPVGREIW